jgi:hypothetical protein
MTSGSIVIGIARIPLEVKNTSPAEAKLFLKVDTG